MLIAGIDCGLTGAVAHLSEVSYAVYDTPSMALKGGTRHDYDIPGMLLLLEHTEHVFIEASQAMPGQGVRSMWTTGYGYGLWLGMCASLHLPYTCVRAAAWKRAVGVTKDKETSRLRAQQLFPLADLRRKKDHGRAEALLLAWYGRQYLLRGE